MSPVLLLGAVLGLVVLGLVGLHALGKGGLRHLHIKASLWPPSVEFDIEHRSD
jgi:hypothetical protein